MSKEIATPRLKSPRVKIEGGSVGIAGEQTGIYPVASPGGWQLIGRTPLKLYDDLFHGLVIVLRNIFNIRTHLSAVENRNFDNGWRRDRNAG